MNYSEELRELVMDINDKGKMISLSRQKDNRIKIEEATKFIDDFYKPPLKIRCLAIQNDFNLFNFPRCYCGKLVSYQKNYHNGFNKFCSVECQKQFQVENVVDSRLNNYDWLYKARIIDQKSKEKIAEEIGCSTGPIVRALKNLKIPEIRLNESNPITMSFLRNSDWLIKEYKENHRPLNELAEEIGSSIPTLSRWLQFHKIEANLANSYDRVDCSSSKACLEINDFIINLGIDTQLNNRTILEGREIDIFIESYKIAIEYNGLYWHQFRPECAEYNLRKDPSYHNSKTKKCLEKGIRLIHIWSDDWDEKPDIWRSRLKSIFGKSKKIFARKCDIEIISSMEKGEFLRRTHLQGNDDAKVILGLKFENNLVAIMTFCKSRFNRKFDWELSRFSSELGISVIGGFSKLLKYFKDNYEGSIISYADKNHSRGDVYLNNGFEFINETLYNSWYTDGLKKFHRAAYMKKKISPNDPRPEHQILLEDYNLRRLFGVGTISFGLRYNDNI